MRSLLFTLLVLLCASAAAETLEKLSIITADGQRIDYQVEVADTPELRSRGLMYRRELAPDRGMLLWYARPVEVDIWMKNTYVPLDIVYIDDSGRVVRVTEGATPLSEKILPSGSRVRAVLEINAGQARLFGIAEGARIVYSPEWPEP